MTYLMRNGVTIAVLDKAERISGTQAVLDIIATAGYQAKAAGMLVYKESFDESFFDLKTGIAGEMLQKISNYGFKLAIVGDFSAYTSKSLQDFIYECNKGRLVFFKSNIDSAVTALTNNP
jgi:hypothetical protein